MSTLDAMELAMHARQLGLLTEQQIQETLEELGERPRDPAILLRAFERKGYLTPWQTSKLLKGDNEGFFLGGYRVLYKIASGSFGRVFRAEDPLTGRVVAIKVLRRRWSEDQQRIDLFNREGKMGLSLQHPNIVEVLNVNRDPATGQYYIVMEFVEGGNLREILAIRKKLEPAEALRLLEEMVTGIAHAYARGVTHRDIKLTNILIAATGEVKLVDFGLAKYFSAAQDDERVERTVDYAGLERATNVPSGDVRSDIYFLGCIMYEMLTGRSPLLMTRDRHARMQRRRFEEVTPIRREEVNAPASVFQLVETMMSLSPHQRYQTPSQLLEAIRACRRESEGIAKPDGQNASTRSVFVVESDQRLQEAIRGKFKELGFRVYMASDPVRALERYRQQPYDALIVDAGTVGEDGLLVFDRIMAEVERQKADCGGVLVLSDDQADWRQRVRASGKIAILVRPVTLKQLHRTVKGLLEKKG